MRGYQQEKRKGPLAFILRGGTHPVSCLEISMGLLSWTQLSNLTLAPKRKPFPREKKEEEGKNGQRR